MKANIKYKTVIHGSNLDPEGKEREWIATGQQEVDIEFTPLKGINHKVAALREFERKNPPNKQFDNTFTARHSFRVLVVIYEL